MLCPVETSLLSRHSIAKCSCHRDVVVQTLLQQIQFISQGDIPKGAHSVDNDEHSVAEVDEGRAVERGTKSGKGTVLRFA